jgi:hypothetical protein
MIVPPYRVRTLESLGEGGKRQSRMMSFVEAVASVAVGFGVAVLVQVVVASLTQNLSIGLVFTAVSIVRSFALRRLFDRAR